MSIGWVPVMMMMVVCIVYTFLPDFCVLDMMFLSGGIVWYVFSGWVCTIRYMFDDWIDNMVAATQQQIWVV